LRIINRKIAIRRIQEMISKYKPENVSIIIAMITGLPFDLVPLIRGVLGVGVCAVSTTVDLLQRRFGQSPPCGVALTILTSGVGDALRVCHPYASLAIVRTGLVQSVK